MFTRFFCSKQGNFVPLYHAQVMKDSREYNLKRFDQVPYFYISLDSEEAMEYFNSVKITIF